MTSTAFDTPIEDTGATLVGPWRQPRQMLHAQSYDSHASIHDATMLLNLATLKESYAAYEQDYASLHQK